jgi:hypothetical protein
LNISDSDLRNFLEREAISSAWRASTQRANIFRIKNDKNVPKFKKEILKFIVGELIPQYKNKVSEEQHSENIEQLVACGTELGKKWELLREHGYKFGTAQKLLNVLLKYNWCFGIVEEPPHCPIDRIILDHAERGHGIKWTSITKRQDYESAIELIRKQANSRELSIAVWELREYARATAT